MKFYEVIDIYENVYAVNVQSIRYIRKCDDGCVIYFENESSAIQPKKPYDEVISDLEKIDEKCSKKDRDNYNSLVAGRSDNWM